MLLPHAQPARGSLCSSSGCRLLAAPAGGGACAARQGRDKAASDGAGGGGGGPVVGWRYAARRGAIGGAGAGGGAPGRPVDRRRCARGAAGGAGAGQQRRGMVPGPRAISRRRRRATRPRLRRLLGLGADFGSLSRCSRRGLMRAAPAPLAQLPVRRSAHPTLQNGLRSLHQGPGWLRPAGQEPRGQARRGPRRGRARAGLRRRGASPRHARIPHDRPPHGAAGPHPPRRDVTPRPPSHPARRDAPHRSLQSRRAALGLFAGAAALATVTPASQAAYGDAANVFGRVTNKSGGCLRRPHRHPPRPPRAARQR
jgi:hypothetical protein